MYFVVQGLGLAGERGRSGPAPRAGTRPARLALHGLVTAGPAVWLFPQPFVRRVILPMLAAIGAL